MLSNAYFLAKFRFDTAENEPAKNLQKFAKFANFANFANPNPHRPRSGLDPEGVAPAALLPDPDALRHLAGLGITNFVGIENLEHTTK